MTNSKRSLRKRTQERQRAHSGQILLRAVQVRVYTEVRVPQPCGHRGGRRPQVLDGSFPTGASWPSFSPVLAIRCRRWLCLSQPTQRPSAPRETGAHLFGLTQHLTRNWENLWKKALIHSRCTWQLSQLQA